MLEMINAIPENVGWVIVGALGMLCAIMGVKVSMMVYNAWKERQEEGEE